MEGRSSRSAESHEHAYTTTARSEKPMPTEPPYLAYVGNMSFEVVEEDVRDLFSSLNVCFLILLLFSPFVD